MSNKLKFKTEIKGNKVGMVRLIYRDPQLWSDDVTFGVMDNYQTQVYLGDISPFNGHTSIMSFNDVEYGIKGNGFYGEKIRDKMSYFNNLSDSSINGVYEVFELKTNTFSP